MQKTMAEILAWVDEVIPNKIPSTSKYRYMVDNLGDSEFGRYNTEKIYLSTNTSTSVSDYDLPSGVRVEDLIYVGVSNTTYNSTNIIGTTTAFVEYKYKGLRDTIDFGYTDYTTKLRLLPVPIDKLHVLLIYKPMYRNIGAATSDSTTIINAQSPLINWLQMKTAARVCKSMAFPRIDLGNNYEIDAENYMANARINYMNTKRKLSKNNISFKDWW